MGKTTVIYEGIDSNVESKVAARLLCRRNIPIASIWQKAGSKQMNKSLLRGYQEYSSADLTVYNIAFVLLIPIHGSYAASDTGGEPFA